MSGAAMNNLLSNGNHTNDNNTSTPYSTLSAAAAAVAYLWINPARVLRKKRMKTVIHNDFRIFFHHGFPPFHS